MNKTNKSRKLMNWLWWYLHLFWLLVTIKLQNVDIFRKKITNCTRKGSVGARMTAQRVTHLDPGGDGAKLHDVLRQLRFADDDDERNAVLLAVLKLRQHLRVLLVRLLRLVATNGTKCNIQPTESRCRLTTVDWRPSTAVHTKMRNSRAKIH